jgi:hypothetical protein
VTAFFPLGKDVGNGIELLFRRGEGDKNIPGRMPHRKMRGWSLSNPLRDIVEEFIKSGASLL